MLPYIIHITGLFCEKLKISVYSAFLLIPLSKTYEVNFFVYPFLHYQGHPSHPRVFENRQSIVIFRQENSKLEDV